MSIKLKLEGFEDLIKEVEAAGGNVDKACDSAIRQSAFIMNSELKNAMKSADVPADLISKMDEPEINKEGNQFYARVGYRKGAYNPANPSDGYKVVFLNYGTPNRTMHGKVKERGFIQKAKKTAKRRIKKEQENAFKKIIERLKR